MCVCVGGGGGEGVQWVVEGSGDISNIRFFLHRMALYCGTLWLLASVTTTDSRNGSLSMSNPM